MLYTAFLLLTTACQAVCVKYELAAYNGLWAPASPSAQDNVAPNPLVAYKSWEAEAQTHMQIEEGKEALAQANLEPECIQKY